MIDDAAVRKAFYTWITKFVSVGTTVIWEGQAEQRPQKPYVSMRMITGPIKTGHDDVETNAQGNTRVSGPRNLTMSINYFGQNAVGAMSKIQGSFELPSCPQHFNPNKMAYISDSGVRDLTAAMENRFETRAQMDVTLSVRAEMTENNTGIIEKVEIINDLDGSSVLIDSTITP